MTGSEKPRSEAGCMLAGSPESTAPTAPKLRYINQLTGNSLENVWPRFSPGMLAFGRQGTERMLEFQVVGGSLDFPKSTAQFSGVHQNCHCWRFQKGTWNRIPGCTKPEAWRQRAMNVSPEPCAPISQVAGLRWVARSTPSTSTASATSRGHGS